MENVVETMTGSYWSLPNPVVAYTFNNVMKVYWVNNKHSAATCTISFESPEHSTNLSSVLYQISHFENNHR